MKSTSERYQHGSVRRVKRASGFAWEFRYYVIQGGRRSTRPRPTTEQSIRTRKPSARRVQGQFLKLNEGTEYVRGQQVTFSALLDR
jgi:hypothetical protein